MSENKKPRYSVTADIPPARSDTPAERAEREKDRERREYHSGHREEFDTVNVDRTSWIISDTVSHELRDGRGNVATSSLNTFTRESDATLRCKDGRKLPESVARDAIGAVYKEGQKVEGWLSDDYKHDDINPLEKACRVNHNIKRHGGREPE